MPWYWILIIISAIVGPFEAMHALNKARRKREEAEKRKTQGENSGQEMYNGATVKKHLRTGIAPG